MPIPILWEVVFEFCRSISGSHAFSTPFNRFVKGNLKTANVVHLQDKSVNNYIFFANALDLLCFS
jgi:hypothetical protein